MNFDLSINPCLDKMLKGKMGFKMGMLPGLFVHGKRESESACVRV